MRWILRIVLGLIALAVFAVAVLFLLPAERIAKVVSDRFESATGRAMTLAGDVRPTLWPELGVKIAAVTIANADWSDAGPMLVAERLSVGVDIAALWSGDVRIRKVEMVAPRLLLETAADGRRNWEMARSGGNGSSPAQGRGTGAPQVPEFTLDRAEITGGVLRIVDRGAGTTTELRDVDLTLSVPDFRGAAELDLGAALNGQRISLAAEISQFADFVGTGAVPVSAEIGVGGNSFIFQGRAGLDPLAAGGRLRAAVDDLGALAALAGSAAPDLPRGLGREIALDAEMTASGAGALALRDMTLRLDHNTLTGGADVSLGGARPKIVAALSAGALDLSAAASEGGGTAPGAAVAAPTGWSRAPIDVSGLQAVDAEVALAAASIDLGMATLGRTDLRIRLEQGRAVTDIRGMEAYGGNVTGAFILNSRGGLSTRADLEAKGVRLKPLLGELAGWDRLETTGDVSVNLLGVGNSVDALMNSWEGAGEIRFGPGALAGLDLVGMLRNLDASYVGDGVKTIFDSIGATFTVKNGVVTNADLTFLSPLLTATGKGRIGLGGRTLDYRLEPKLLNGVRVPVLITGTWADPKFRLDLEALAKERLDAEAEKVKAKAEAEVIERLNEELGVTIEAKEDIDDVLKQELEQRARDGLLDLLGGRN